MATKKEISKTANMVLHYFNAMFKHSGAYKEKKEKDLMIIKFVFEKLEVKIALTKEEYTYWRTIKPKMMTKN